MFKKNIDIGFDLKWENIPDDHHFKSTMKQIYEIKFKFASQRLVDHMLAPHYYIINGLPIFFKKDDNVISIDVSGGADSTLLLYILCKIITTLNVSPKIVAITMIRHWETKSSAEGNVDDIIDYIKARFPKLDIVRERGFVPPGMEFTSVKDIKFGPNNKSVFANHIMEGADAGVYAVHNFNEYIRQKYKIKRAYGGITTNPTDITGPQFRQLRELTADDLVMYLQDWPRQDPFLYIQKDWVMAQYENFKIEDLRDMTRSCSQPDADLDILFGKNNWTISGSKYICCTCFFCKERAWAHENRSVLLQQNHI
jgi:hypothetical protein